MELVYLWVKKYKNIDRQEFNFSPKFTCKYDEDSNELTIDKNNDYIKNFFGDNINVTAIVGKNGSGKSSLLEVLEEIKNLKDIIHIIIYKREENFYCEYKNNLPNIIGDIQVSVMDNDSFSKKNTFYPKILRIAHSERIGEKRLSHYYFGEYSGLYGSMDAGRLDFYNMLEARFFVPRYVNIALEYFEIFKALKQMYKFDTLRLILRNNTTGYIRKYIDDEISTLKRGGYLLRHDIFCVYEKNIQTTS